MFVLLNLSEIQDLVARTRPLMRAGYRGQQEVSRTLRPTTMISEPPSPSRFTPHAFATARSLNVLVLSRPML